MGATRSSAATRVATRAGAAAGETGLRRVEHEAMIWGPHRTGVAPYGRETCPLGSSGSASAASSPGEHDAITDVPGVRVGHETLIEGEGGLEVGRGPIRTGVTVVMPHDGDVWAEPVFAGCHRLNGNGELTGLEWIREAGLLGGARRDHQHAQRGRGPRRPRGQRDRPTAEGRRAVVAARRRRDLGRPAQRHRRPPRPAGARRRGDRPRARRAGGAGERRRRDRDGLPRVQGRDRHGVAGRRGRGRRLDRRRAGPGELRRARAAARRRRARSAPRAPATEVPTPYAQAEAVEAARAAADAAGRGRGRSRVPARSS